MRALIYLSFTCVCMSLIPEFFFYFLQSPGRFGLPKSPAKATRGKQPPHKRQKCTAVNVGPLETAVRLWQAIKKDPLASGQLERIVLLIDAVLALLVAHKTKVRRQFVCWFL